MIYSEKDPFNAADRRDVMINPKDAEELYIQDGEAIVLFNRYGTFQGRAKYATVQRGNTAVYWPEGNVLIPKGVYENHARIPEYNTAVMIEKAEIFHSRKDPRYAEKRIEELEMSTD